MDTTPQRLKAIVTDHHASFTTIWLFQVLIALEARSPDGGWMSYLLPIGALLILMLYARAWREHQRVPR